MSQTVKLRRSATSGSVPTTSQLALGELAINTYDGKLYLKKNVSGTETIVEIGANNLADTFHIYEYSVTSNTTVFQGSDDNSHTLSYTTGSPPRIAVFLNGLLLDWGTDFTATNGSSVTLTSAAVSGDLVQIQAYKSTVVAGSNLMFADDVKAQFGDDGDLEIYHDGTRSIINDVGTGNLQFQVGGTAIYDVTTDGIVLADGLDVEANEFIGDLRGAVLFKAQAGEALAKGDVVYISGVNGNTTIVSKADANDASKMPAFGVAAAAITSGTTGDIYTFGTLSGLDTSGFSLGDELFVSTTAGGLTNSAPTGSSSLIQKIAKVTRSDNSAGSIKIMGAGRTNATPNLDEGKIFVGNSSNQSVQVDSTINVDMANSQVLIDNTLKLGSSGQLEVYHDGSNGVLNNTSGHLQIYNNADDGDIQFISDNGSGGTAEYFRVDGGADRTIFSKNTRHENDVRAYFGTNSSAEISYAGGNFVLQGFSGDTKIINYANDKDVILGSDDGSGGVTDYIRLDGSNTRTIMYQNVIHHDDVRAHFGNGNDLSIYHDGTSQDGFIINNTEDLIIRNDADDKDVIIQADNGSGGRIAYFRADGSTGEAKLLHYGNLKLTTQSGGVLITGELESDSLDVNGVADISGNLTVGGDLIVNGSTTTLNTSTLTVDDINITIADGAADAAAANGAGITVDGANATLTYLSSGDKWKFNKELEISDGSSAIAFNEYNNGATIWLDGSNGDFTGGDYFNISAYGTTDLAFGYGAGTKITMKNDGKLGIGTDSPANLLSVESTGQFAGINIKSASSNGISYLDFGDADDNNIGGINYDNSTDTLQLRNGNAHHVFLKTDGKVGIGDGNPPYKLSVNSGISDWPGYFKSTDNKAGLVIADDDTTGYFGVENSRAFMGLQAGIHVNNLNIKSNGFVGLGTTDPLDLLHLKSTTTDARAVIDGHTDFDAELKFAENGSVKYTVGHDAGTDNFVIGTTNVDTDQRFVIDSSGNVGISRTSPRAKLDVNGSINIETASSISLDVDTYTDTAILIPRGTFIKSNTTGDYQRTLIGHNGTSGNGSLQIGQQGTSIITDIIMYPGSSGNIRFYPSGNEDVRFDISGNVGIGNTNPQARLQVEEYGIDTTETSTSATTQTVIHTMSASDFRSARFTIQVTNSTDSTYHTTEILMVHDGTTANITEFGKVFTANEEATFDADVSSGNVRLLATPATTDSMEFKVVCHSVTV